MRLLTSLASALAWGATLSEAKAVFAHYMVGNTKSLGLDDWRHEIQAAQGAGIDAFALNMASGDSTNNIALPMAFTAADDMGFQLLFSFDYAGNGPWDKSIVIDMIKEYGSRETYFKHNGDSFVSTFEGPGNADDWKDIKKETGCFFIPDWSSVGAAPAVKLGDGVADGLFSWDAWSKGPANVTTYPNASYYDFLGSKPYMMPISPWFYTNLPGYNKNWLWRGDDMWFHQWQQAISLDRLPDWIQIISWNDYGESHYIGPLDDRQYEAFDIGRAPYNYVKDMPHDGWRETLPYYISMYKEGKATVTEERLVTWFRVNKNGACSDGGTTGNTANQLQFEYSANNMMEDRIFYDVLLGSDAQIEVSIGGVTQAGTWDQEPYGGVGVYHGSVPIGSASGYAAICTRPDIALAHSKLAQHLTNLLRQYINAVNRVIAYLYNTRFFALEYNSEACSQIVMTASDAAFANNHDMKSTRGYLCLLYGGPIEWKSWKQRTVLMLTTEAEYISAIEATKSLYWWQRVFTDIELDPEEDLEIYYDNSTTVGLLSKESIVNHMKLRHVDIHREWLRQEVQNQRVKISWVPIAEMPADGLTKSLPGPKHQEFIKMLNMRDISSFISD